MGDKINNVQAMMNNPKQRNIYLMGVGIAVVTLVAGFMYATSGNNNETIAGSAQVAKVPAVNSIPGTSDSARYNTAVTEANKHDANNALEAEKSFVPTPVNNNALSTESPLDSLDKQIKAQKEAEAREQAERQAQVAIEQPLVPENNQLSQNPMPVQPVQTAQVVTPPTPPAPKVKKYGTDEDFLIMQAIHGVSGIKAARSENDFLGKSGSAVNAGNMVQAAQPTQLMQSASTQNKGELLAKAGTIFNAVLETAINSDEPSPVLAKIVSGDLKGTRLIGKISNAGEKVVIQFSTASIPSMATSVKFDAVAVDPGTSRTALASDVDHHYFLRYGVLLGSAFLGSYADALANKNSTTTVTPEGSIITTRGELSNKDMSRQALGTVGKELATDTRARTQGLQPTITVHAGVPIGILVTEDLFAK